MKAPMIITAVVFLSASPLRAQSYPPLHVDPSLKQCSVIFASSLTQANFRRFVREFGSVSAYKQLGPASTLERGQVSLGIEMMDFTVDEWAPAWNDTFAHPNDHHPLGNRQSFPKIKFRAGLGENLDVGAFFARNPEANYGWLGIDGKYRLLTEGGDVPVSLAVRGAYTKTLYVHDMDMHAATVDVSVERRFWGVVRPYVGVGADGVYARETSDVVALRNEATVVPHAFGGVDVTVLRRVSIGAEYTRGALPSMQVQVGAVIF